MKLNPQWSTPTVMDLETGISMSTRRGFEGLNTADKATSQQILNRAYTIWDRAGHPENRQLDHWLAAEAEVLGEDSYR